MSIDQDGSLRIIQIVGNQTLLDEEVLKVPNTAKPLQLQLDIPADADDLEVSIPDQGFDGTIVFRDPNNTGELSIKLRLNTNESRQVSPIHTISGSDSNGLTSIFVTNSNATNANELWVTGVLDSST